MRLAGNGRLSVWGRIPCLVWVLRASDARRHARTGSWLRGSCWLPVLLAIATIAACPGAALAQPIAEESFDYAVGSTVWAGGSGFSGSWTLVEGAGPRYSISPGSVQDPLVCLPASGNRLTGTVVTSAPFSRLRRTLSQPAGGSPGAVVYVSLVVRPEGILGQGGFFGFFGATIQGTMSSLSVGKSGLSAAGPYVLCTDCSLPPANDALFASADVPALLIVKIEFFAGNERCTLYANPVPDTGEPVQGTVLANADLGAIAGIDVYNSGAFSVDEIRVGTSYDSVMPSSRQVLVQPGNAATCRVGSATFSLTVRQPQAVTYSWRKGGIPINPAANPSAATPTLTLSNVQEEDAGLYDCVVSNACGVSTSDAAALTVCQSDFNCDGSLNLDDVADFITDFYTAPPIPGGLQVSAPTYEGALVGFGVPCPGFGPDAPLPYASGAYRQWGYRVGYSPNGDNACPTFLGQPFPNLDNLSDYITGYYDLVGTGGC